MTSENILDRSAKTKTSSSSKGMVLLWSSYDYNINNNEYKNNSSDFESIVKNSNSNDNNNNITWKIIRPSDAGDNNKKIFSERNLENILTNMQNDPLALSCWVLRELDEILITKKKKVMKIKQEDILQIPFEEWTTITE